ncbi:MAG TPA: hypothetical protein VH539_05110 [Gemmatimonadaceae bacterium]|jgi:hypothetical protein
MWQRSDALTAVVAGSTLLVLACSHAVQAPSPIATPWVTSDSSQYSPVARFRALTTVVSDGVEIAIDSGSLTVPGTPAPDVPPVMSNLYITAILAVGDTSSFVVVRPGDSRNAAERRGWRPVAMSDSVRIVDALRYGEQATFPPLRLFVPTTAALPTAPAWIVYRIVGTGVELVAPLTAGDPIRRIEHRGAVRVYACGDNDVRGNLDPARRVGLRRAYGIAC